MTDLATLLRDAEPDLTLDVPVALVVRRGAGLRRRRRVVAAGLVAAVLVPAAALTSLTLGPGPDRTHAADQVSGPPMIDLPPDVLTQADQECRETVAWTGHPLAELFAAARTATHVLLLYHGNDAKGPTTTVCTHGDSGLGFGRVPESDIAPGPGHELVADATELSDLNDDGDSSLVVAGRVGPDVYRVVASVHGQEIEAAVDRGWFWFWAPVDESGPPDHITAFGDRGQALETVMVDAISTPPSG